MNKTFFIITFLLTVFLLPFNGFPYGKNIWGELSVELSYYPAYILVLLFIFNSIKNKKIYFFEDKLFNYIIFAFYLWTILSFLINYSEISKSVFKNRTGFEKFVLQEFVLIFGIITSVSIYNFLKISSITVSDLFVKIKKVIFFTFILSFIWGIFEFVNKFTYIYDFSFLKRIDCFLSISCNGYQDRLKFFTGEPSWFGIYLIFAFPFFINYINEFKNIFFTYLLFFIFIFFSYFTFSRTLYIVVIFELLLFSIFYFYEILSHKKLLKYSKNYLIFLLFSLFIFNTNKFIGIFSKGEKIKVEYLKNKSFIKSFSEKSYASQSNKTRKTMQIIGIKIGLDNPIFGVGLGQYGFHAKKYTDPEIFNKQNFEKYNIEIDNYFNKDGIWPPVHGLLGRIFAELGIVGFILWISIWLYLLYKLIISLKSSVFTEEKIILIIIASSLQLLNFSSDTFRFLGYWITISLTLFLLKENANEQNIR